MSEHDVPEYPPLVSVWQLALFHRNVRFVCNRCRHQRVFSGRGLWWLCDHRGWDQRIKALPPRFWCLPCLLRHRRRMRGPTYTITREPPNGEPLPEPDERELKRMARRYRC